MSTTYVVGLTGGIGSGKSAATTRFEMLGATIVDTDAIAHELTTDHGAAIKAIREAFGPAVITPSGALDRARMRALVFEDTAARKRLEGILHPMIRSESAHRCNAASGPYVVLAVPLLIESGHWRERCQRICVIDCPEELQVQRVMMRSGLQEAQVRAIIAAQTSRDDRLSAADDVVDNSDDLPSLHRQVDALHAHYLTLATSGGVTG